MPKYISENGQLYILYDNCEEYIYLGPDPQYENGHIGPLFVDIELKACCKGEKLPQIPLTPTPSVSVTPTVTATNTPSVTVSVSQSPTPSISATPTLTPTTSITPSSTTTPSPTPTISPTHTVTPTITPSNTPTTTTTPSVTASNTPSATVTPTVSVTASVTPTTTPTISVTPSVTVTPSPTPTPSPTSVYQNPIVEDIYLYDLYNNPYELWNIDYAPSISSATGSDILAVAIPLNNSSHNFLTTESDTSTSYDKSGNMLLCSNSYFSSFIYKKKEIDIFQNTSLWNNTKYPASRVSSVHYNKDLNRWFLGCRSEYSKPTIFLYGYDNGSMLQFFVGGNSLLPVNHTNSSIDGLLCGPTKIHSLNNKVFLANSDFVYVLLTSDTNGNASGALDYTFKQFAHKCTDSTSCGLYDNIPDSIATFYHALATIVDSEVSEHLEIIFPYSPYTTTSVDSQPYVCPSTSFYKGYSLSSQDFGVDVSTSIVASDYIIMSFTESITIDNFDIIRNDIPISKSLYSFSGFGSSYDLFVNDSTLLASMLQDKINPYYMRIAINNSSTNIPSTIFIPLYNADSGFSINNNTLISNKQTNIATPVFIVNGGSHNGQNYLTKYYANSSSSCDSRYEYTVQNDAITANFCMADIPSCLPESSIKCILAYEESIYTFVQIEADPDSVPNADHLYFYNLYKSNFNTPNVFDLVLNNIASRRIFRNANEKVYDIWQHACMIDNQYIIIGIQNSNHIIKIDHTALSVISNPPIAVDKQDTNNVCIPNDNDDIFSNFEALNCAKCSFDENNTITGLCSGATINGFDITYNGFEHNKLNNGSYYFVCSVGDSTAIGSDAVSDFILGEPVDLVASDPTLSIDNLTICYKSDSKNYMILQGSNTGLSYLPGYGCSTISNIKELSNDDFIP